MAENSQVSAPRGFLIAEHSIYISLGVLLAVVAVVALVHSGIEVLRAVVAWHGTDDLLPIMDDLLFVLMIGEILHTVRVSVRDGTLNAEPFLVVGLIASIRRVLILTFESPMAKPDQDWTPQMQALFRAGMTELGVLALLIVVMVVGIVLVRRSAARRGEAAG